MNAALRLSFGFRIVEVMIGCCAVWLGIVTTPAQGGPRAQAERVYEAKQKQFEARPKDPAVAWQLGRACFDLGELATNSAERAEFAERGINACRQALATGSNSAPAHYYIGLNLGELARTRSIGALKLVNQMERELTEARELDAHFDYAGPDRSLGLLYRDAPSLISIGSRAKAKQHLRRAIELAPDYPENRLDLIDSDFKWGDRNDAHRELTALEAIWPKARQKLSGPEWAASWEDWQSQLDAFKKKMEEASKLESPRH